LIPDGYLLIAFLAIEGVAAIKMVEAAK